MKPRTDAHRSVQIHSDSDGFTKNVQISTDPLINTKINTEQCKFVQIRTDTLKWYQFTDLYSLTRSLTMHYD